MSQPDNSVTQVITATEREAIEQYGSITNMIQKITDISRVSDERAVSLVSRIKKHREDIANIRASFIGFCDDHEIKDEAAGFIDRVNATPLHVQMEPILNKYEVDVRITATVEITGLAMVHARSQAEAEHMVSNDYTDIDGFDPEDMISAQINWAEISIDRVELA